MPAISRAEPRARTGAAPWARIGAHGWPAATIPSASLWLLAAALVAMPSYSIKVNVTRSITPNVLELVLPQ